MPFVSDLRGTRTGTCYILGCSFHLELIRLEELCRSQAVLGISRSCEVCAPTWLLFSDLRVFQEELQVVRLRPSGLLLWNGLRGFAEKNLPGRPKWYWATQPRTRGVFRRGPRELEGAFRWTGNSGTYAVETADLMGFSEIALLGMDLRYDLSRTHIRGNWKDLPGCHPPNLTRVTREFKLLVDRLKAAGKTLVNESPIDGPLDAVVPRRASPWLKNQSG